MLRKLIVTSSLLSMSAAHALTLEEYLEQVKQNSLTYKSATTQGEASDAVAREADLITTPKLFASARSSADSLIGTPPVSMYNELRSNAFQVGVNQTFNFGLDLKLAVSASKYNLIGFNSSTQSPRYWDVQPGVEFTMPLWAGGFGSLVRAQEELTRKQNKADSYASFALSLQTIAEAENAYYALALAQERLEIQERSLGAGKNILSFVNGQKNKNLGETADVLQARALVEAYELQLKQAQNQLLKAERDFNKLLNKDVKAVVTKLDKVDFSKLRSIKHPTERPGDRFDVLAQKAQIDLAKASSDLVIERNKPQLNLMGGYKVQGRDSEKFSKAVSDVSNDHFGRYIGLQFSMPLNVKALNDARSGAQRLKEAANIKEANLEYSQNQDWTNIRETLQESQESLTLALAMEKAHKAKLENERVRLRQGRTTTYQVLLFEQDYTNAQASTLAIANQIIALDAQLKLFVVNPQGDK